MVDELVSIIVPVYNVERYIEKCVDSLVNQTYKNIEIILVDDGSKDGSGGICDHLKLQDKRIIVIHKKNGGLSDARNAGIKVSSGSYVAFIDSDDYIDKRFIEILYKNAVETGAEISISNFEKFIEGESPRSEGATQKNSRVVMSKKQGLEALFSNEYNYQFTIAWGKIFKAELLKDFEFPVGRNYEDSATAHILISKSNRIVYTDRKQYFYLIRKTSITKSDKFLKDDVIIAMRERVEWFSNNGYYDLEKKAQVQYVFTLMGVFARLTNSNEAKKKKEQIYNEVNDFAKKNSVLIHSSKTILFRIRVFLLAPDLYSVIIRKVRGFKL